MNVYEATVPACAEGMQAMRYIQQSMPLLPAHVVRDAFAARDVKCGGKRVGRDEPVLPGEKVQLVLKGSAGNKAVVLAYLLPFVVLMIALFGTYALTKSELAGVIVSLVFVILYFILLKTQNKRIERQFQFFVKRMPE